MRRFFQKHRFQFSVRTMFILVAVAGLVLFGIRMIPSWLREPTGILQVMGDPSVSLTIPGEWTVTEVADCPNLEVLVLGSRETVSWKIRDCPKLQFIQFSERTPESLWLDKWGRERKSLGIQGCPLVRELKLPVLNGIKLADLDVREVDFSLIRFPKWIELARCRLPTRLEFPRGVIRELIIRDIDSKELEIRGAVTTLILRDNSKLVKLKVDGFIDAVELENLPALTELWHLDRLPSRIVAKDCPNLQVKTWKGRP